MILSLVWLTTCYWRCTFPCVQGPVRRFLEPDDTIAMQVEGVDYSLASLVWMRKGKIIAQGKIEYWMEPQKPEMRVMSYGRDHFLVYKVAWGTGDGWEFAYVATDPPRIRVVGTFESGVISEFGRTGRTRAYPRHDSMGYRTRDGQEVWVEAGYHWDTRNKKFVLSRKRWVKHLPHEADPRRMAKGTP